jgi:hypothetical protein
MVTKVINVTIVDQITAIVYIGLQYIIKQNEAQIVLIRIRLPENKERFRKMLERQKTREEELYAYSKLDIFDDRGSVPLLTTPMKLKMFESCW